ncbi:response regulator [Streptomyces triculaminicus]|uniref:response regulator n=1 Tax=Streptomyces triculaminicus TaxID=2816232 RepID=UPI0037B64D6D
MIVDDEVLVRAGLQQILESAGDVDVLSTCDGVTAIEEVARRRPDVVLLDLRMPGVDGLTVLSSLRQQEPAPAVAMLTAFSADEEVARALSLGAAGFLLKDSAPEDFVHAVRLLASGNRVFSPHVARHMIDGYLGSLESAGKQRHSPAEDPRLASLTAREHEVLALVSAGLSNPQISRKLFVSTATIKEHVSSIIAKMRVDNRIQAAVLAHQLTPEAETTATLR